MSVLEVRGFGHHAAAPPHEGDRTEVDAFENKVRLEIYCRGSDVTAILDAIRQAARTGHPGDGKIFVVDVAWAIRVRTGEIGADALTGGTEALG